jgi:hypothetical protein
MFCHRRVRHVSFTPRLRPAEDARVLDVTDHERAELITELTAAKAEQSRCMGGVDMAGCVRASNLVTALRLRLRDDASLFDHFLKVIETPASIRRRPARR